MRDFWPYSVATRRILGGQVCQLVTFLVLAAGIGRAQALSFSLSERIPALASRRRKAVRVSSSPHAHESASLF
jgi:hypothetical protein